MNLEELNQLAPTRYDETPKEDEKKVEGKADDKEFLSEAEETEQDLYTALALLDEVRELLNDVVVVHIHGDGKMFIPKDRQKDVFKTLECVNDFLDEWDLNNQEAKV